MGALPAGFWTTFAALALAACGLACAVCALPRPGHALARLRGFRRAQGGSTIVEFPFALLVIVMITLLTWQLGYLMCGYLVVDRAAYAAVRAAVVSSGEDAADGPEGRVVSEQDTALAARRAGAAACAPISGHAPQAAAYGFLVDPLEVGLGVGQGAFQYAGGWAVLQVEGLRDEPIDPVEFESRYSYAVGFTRATVVRDTLTSVELTHHFFLDLAFADRILGDSVIPTGGYATEIRARASMLSEKFAEKAPPGAPPVVRIP